MNPQIRLPTVNETSIVSDQQTSVLSQQRTSVLSQQQTSVLSQQKTSLLSQQHIVCVSETGQGPDTCNRDGSRQPYSNFSNRPHPPRQNRGAVLMGIVLWRVTENPKIAILGFGQNPTFQKKGYDLDIRPSGGNSGWHGWMRRQKLV